MGHKILSAVVLRLDWPSSIGLHPTHTVQYRTTRASIPTEDDKEAIKNNCSVPEIPFSSSLPFGSKLCHIYLSLSTPAAPPLSIQITDHRFCNKLWRSLGQLCCAKCLRILELEFFVRNIQISFCFLCATQNNQVQVVRPSFLVCCCCSTMHNMAHYILPLWAAANYRKLSLSSSSSFAMWRRRRRRRRPSWIDRIMRPMDKLLHMEWSLVWSSGRSLGRSGLAARVKLHNHPQMCSFRLLNSREKKSIRLCCRLRPINGRGSGGGGCTTHASIQSTIHQRQATASELDRRRRSLEMTEKIIRRGISVVLCVCVLISFRVLSAGRRLSLDVAGIFWIAWLCSAIFRSTRSIRRIFSERIRSNSSSSVSFWYLIAQQRMVQHVSSSSTCRWWWWSGDR